MPWARYDTQPMPRFPSTCPLDCPDACGVIIETDDEGRFLRLAGNPQHSWSRGSLCGKTAIYHEMLQGGGRLSRPLLRGAGGEFEEVSWDRALDVIAERFSSVSGEELLALSYGGNMGLVGRRFPMRVMNALGATETDGGLCDTPSTAGFQTVLGNVVGPDLEQVEQADLLLLWGSDARRTMQHLMPRLRRLCQRGVPVVVIDIYRTDTVRAIERWGGRGLILKPGTDAALALGLAELAFQRGDADMTCLRTRCDGAAELRAELTGKYSLQRVSEITGLDPAAITRLADELGGARQAWIKTGVGWCRRRNGAMGMRAVATLASVLGIADRMHYESFDNFDLDESSILGPWRRPAGGSAPISHVGLGRELESGRFRACMVWNHNPAVTVPDSQRVRAGLVQEDLFLVVHELVMTETAKLADVVLPSTALPEHTEIFRSYGHRVLQVSRRATLPPDEQRSNVGTFRALAQRMGLPRDLWEVTEEGLVDQLLSANAARFKGDQLQRLRAGEPVKLGTRMFPDQGTPGGRIELASRAAAEAGQPAVATYVPDDGAGGSGRFWLVSAPTVATHNSTYMHSERHLARNGAPSCWMHPEDASELGLEEGEGVRLTNEQGALTLPLACSTDQPRGLLRIDGFPDPAQTPEGLSSNALTSPEISDLGAGNVQYSTRVDIAAV